MNTFVLVADYMGVCYICGKPSVTEYCCPVCGNTHKCESVSKKALCRMHYIHQWHRTIEQIQEYKKAYNDYKSKNIDYDEFKKRCSKISKMARTKKQSMGSNSTHKSI